MKRYKFTIFFAFILTIAIATIVIAAGRQAYDRSRAPLQNLNSIAPSTGSNRCDTTTKTKGTFKTYTATGYIGIEAEVVDSAGAPVNVKWRLDGVQVGVGSKLAITNNGGNTFTNASYDGYSAASRSLNSCIRRQ